MKFKEDKSWLQ